MYMWQHWNDRRETPRFIAKTAGVAINLTRRSKPERAAVVEVSARGMRIQTALIAAAGEALQIEMPGLTVLGEITRFEVGPTANVLAMKLLHSLDHAELAQWVEPGLWEGLRPESDSETNHLRY